MNFLIVYKVACSCLHLEQLILFLLTRIRLKKKKFYSVFVFYSNIEWNCWTVNIVSRDVFEYIEHTTNNLANYGIVVFSFKLKFFEQTMD